MFKVGDRYRVVKDGEYSRFSDVYPVGSVFTVSRVDFGGDGVDETGRFYITSEDVATGILVKVTDDQKHSHYYKEWDGKIDIYRLLLLYEVTDPCLQHAIKKLLCTGNRGHKDFRKDIEDVIDTLNRRLEMLDEDEM